MAAGSAVAAPLAFPGAEGFAATVTGGRKGQVVHVTSLSDSGSGSLRDAVSQGSRIVVFDISGVIKLADVLVVGGDNITLAGQSAPGDGITIYGRETSFSSRSNIIVRYLRFRQGMTDTSGSAKKTVNITDGQNMIFDHVSIQWGRWDNFGITGTSSTVTLQNSIIGEGVPPQNFGSIIDGEQDITIAHNLWIDNNERNPKFKANGECINNVVYNWGTGGGIIGGHSGTDWYEDYIGNYLIAGPSAVDKFFTFYTNTDHAYQTGNMVDVNKDGQLNGRAVVNADFEGTTPPTFETAAHSKPPVPVTVLSAEDAYARVVAQAGTCQHRDAVELRLIGQLTSLGTKGAIIADESDVGGQPAMTQVTRPAGFDTDGDGIPDTWETAHGLNPNSASDGSGDYTGDGYTNVEKYLNELADLACPGGTTTPPETADAGTLHPVDAAVPPVDARDTPASGGVTGTGGITGAGGAATTGGVMGTGGAMKAGGTTAGGGVTESEGGSGGSGMGGAVSMGGRVGSGGGVGTGSSAATGGAIGAGGLSASGGVVSTGPVGAGGRAGTGGTPGIGTTGGATTVTSGAQASSGGCSCRTAGVETRSYRVFALLGFVMVALRLRKRRSMTGAEGDGGTSTVTGAVRKPMVEITAPECSSPSASTGTPMGFWLGTGGIP
jgi:MYXO-CTERM domain-containing protein